MPKPAFLFAVANPYAVLDPDGEPCSVSYRAEFRKKAIGAALDPERSRDGCLKFTFSAEPVQLSNRVEHRKLIQSGQLIAADRETARLCGISDFREPAAELAKKRSEAAAAFLAAYGELPPFAREPASAAPAAPPTKTPSSPPAAPAGGDA